MRLLSFLSKKVVSTNWRIYKGVLVGPRFLRQGISRGFRECELFFSTAKFAKYRDLKRKKSFVKEENPSQWALLRKAMILGTEYMQKSSFQRCCASQNKTQPRTQSITFAYLLLRKYPALVPAGHVAPKILNYQGREGQISNFNASTFQK
jgi:hypothetical protein